MGSRISVKRSNEFEGIECAQREHSHGSPGNTQ